MSIRTITTVGAVALIATSAAAVETAVQSDSFSGIPNFSGTFTFDQWDAADFGNPGDIDFKGVEVKIKATIDNGLLQVDNDGIDPAIINTAELGANVNLTSPTLLAALPGASPATQGSFNLAADNGDTPAQFDFEPGDPDYDELVGSMVMDMDTLAANDALATAFGFVGAGTFDIDYEALAIFDFGGVGGVSFAGTPVDLTIEVTVTYLYNIVPAPAGLAAFGLAGLAAIRRRR